MKADVVSSFLYLQQLPRWRTGLLYLAGLVESRIESGEALETGR